MKTNDSNGGRGGDRAVSVAQLRDGENRRFLRQMPLFQADNDVPDRFDKLLSQLEAIERGARGYRPA